MTDAKDTGRTDGELLSAYVERQDSQAFRELHARYAALVFSLAMRSLKNAQDAEDVSAACFVLLARKAGSLKSRQNIGGWLHWCALRTARNACVVRMHRIEREQEVYEMQKPGREKDADTFHEIMPQLEARLAELPPVIRDVLVMFFYHGLTRIQISERIGRPEGTIASWISRGVATLRKSLGTSWAGISDESFSENFAKSAVILPVPAGLLMKLTLLAEGKDIGVSVAALADRVARSVFWGQVKSAAAVAASLTFVGYGAVLLAQSSSGKETPPAQEQAKVAAPVEQNDGQKKSAAMTNPFNGSQEREKVFEFAEKPVVKKDGTKVTIAFTSKAFCDVTVAIVGPDAPPTATGHVKIVRHLASGVLGKNAPWPFKQDSLAQSMEWDGMDDRGKPAPAGCRVRVSLGLKATYDRLLAREPAFLGYRPGGLTCDSEGNVYCLIQNQGTTLYVMDKNGKYLRTVAPFPGHLSPDNLSVVEFTERTDGVKVPSYTKADSVGYCFYKASVGSTIGDSPVCLSPDGRTLLFVGRTNDRWALYRAGIDGSLVAPPLLLNYSQQYGPPPGPNMVISPDGAWVYWTGNKSDKAAHTVVRQKLDALTVCAPNVKHKTPPEVFAGELDKPGSDDTHLKEPQGLAFDAAGNIYVADQGNNRVQVFGPDGKFVRSCPATAPWKVQVHPKTGELYVLCEDWVAKKSAVMKFDKDGKSTGIEAVLVQDKKPPYGLPSYFCLDSSGPESAVWTSDVAGVKKFVERSGKFEKVVDLGEEKKKNWPGWDLPCHPLFHGHQWMAADPYREEIYLREGGTCEGSAIYRIDGRTGNLIDKPATYKSNEVHVGPDGLAYVRIDSGRIIVKFDPATGKGVPFEKGNFDVDFKGQKVKAIKTVMNGGGRTFQDGICVAPNGDIYVVISEVKKPFQAELVKIGQAKNMKSPGGSCGQGWVDFLQVFGPDGSIKHISAIPGLVHCNGIRVARNGNVMLNAASRKTDLKVPYGIAPGKPFYKFWGTLICFDSAFDKFPIGYYRGTWDESKPDRPATHIGSQYSNNPMVIEPIRWDFGGVSPSYSQCGGCVCQTSRCDLDGFDRAFAPATHTMSVNALDSNGNIMLKFGRYGNPDSRASDSAVLDPKTGFLRTRRADDPADLRPPKELAEEPAFYWAPYVAVTDEAVYINDQGNTRIVRCILSYQTEEFVPAP